ncbi:MAG: flavodoxin-dependent (E)-4-hydroxy-3-methylbut-2-enyl-diphosphate synthase [Candidatus Aceula meridiana]|nr:flavodoxin-dependent (E)-4-hydroxy-3-methylbut-2-enyl-diphosphate synthase [Candidatus Aceula meridiana]
MIQKRHKTPTVFIDHVPLGSSHPIVIQSMTNTKTTDVTKTVGQIKELANSGSELVRITINNDAAMKAVVPIIKRLRAGKYQIPIIGDFHYNGHILLKKYPQSAALLSKYRINPGNVGNKKTADKNFTQIIQIAIKHKKPVRIGVNFGSLDQKLLTDLMRQNARMKNPKTDKQIIYKAMVESALSSAKAAEKIGLPKNKIILSVKMSDVQDMIAVYQKLAKQCNYVLHLGLTEAGGGTKGIVASTVSLGILLQKGIGGTIRISLTPQKNANRAQEVTTCKLLLQSMGLRYFSPQVISCPGCGRTSSDYFEKLAQATEQYIQKQLPAWKKKYQGFEQLKIAVMGCVVNGPGESKYANIGISLPGDQEKPDAPIYVNGQIYKTLKGKNIKTQFFKILENYIRKTYK